MPEGHTIHRLAEAMGEAFGRSRVRLGSPQGRFEAEAAEVDGWVLTEPEAVGKHLFLPFAPAPDAEASRFIHIHLGLYGSWTFAGDPTFLAVKAIGAPRRSAEADGGEWAATIPGPNVRLRMEGQHGLADLTGPNQCRLIDAAERDEVIARLGPDPLRADADVDEFVRRIKKSRQAIGQLLMDQRVAAGIGNIYRAELLFRARLDPYVPGKDLSEPLIRDLWRDLVPLMEYGKRTGRIVTTQVEHRGRHNELNERHVPAYQRGDARSPVVPREESFYVYHRQGFPCRVCESVIHDADMAGRGLYWCPGCQKKRVRRAGWIDTHPASAWAEVP
ncbi:MAG: zinc finger domain-containing protein [Dermabacter sp.]|nr:zinc finger domain-containing protein [Dermabacter sp.]